MKTKTIITGILLCVGMSACGKAGSTWTDAEKTIINSSREGIMRVLQTDDTADALLLREKSALLDAADSDSPELGMLIEGMLATVQDTAKTGVGIAAPQVGILRRLIIVQRFDKEGHPFEPYINPYITWYSDSLRTGGEGCLSIPDIYGLVARSNRIVVEYDKTDGTGRTSDTVNGFTAAIFQHEVDHLDGILFTDRMSETVK